MFASSAACGRRRADGERQREHPDHRVPGAGDVEDLPGDGRDVQRLEAGLKEAHPGLAPGDQDRRPARTAQQGRTGLLHGLLEVGRPVSARSRESLRQIRGDHRGAPVEFKPRRLGVDGDRPRRLSAVERADTIHQLILDQSLAVIGDDHGVDLRPDLPEECGHGALHLRGMRAQPLPVEADHLLLVGDDAALEDGRAAGVRAGCRRRRSRPRPSCSRSQLPSASSPTTPQTSTAAPRHLRLCATLAAPPNRCVSSRDLDDRHRSLGGDAPHHAGIVAVDHEIADHEDPGPRKGVDAGAEAATGPGRSSACSAGRHAPLAGQGSPAHALPGPAPGVQGTASSKIITGMSSVTG